jgi:hypothetical protein
MDRKSRRGAIARALLTTTALSLAATAAQAAATTWELKGTITIADFSPSPDPDVPSIPVGTPFRLLVTYDAAAPFTTRSSAADPVTGDPRPGIRYQYSGVAALKFALYAGADCNPCTPAAIPSRNGIFVRDDFADPLRNPPPDVPYDGYSFFMDPHPDDGNYGWLVIFRDQSANFDFINVSGSSPQPLPVEPDPVLTQLATRSFEVSYNNAVVLQGRVESVGIPTYGTAYVLTGRDCSYPDLNANAIYDECISSGIFGGWNRYIEEGGGPGQGDFSRTTDLQFPIWAPAPPAPLRSLGSVFASATFGGPAALPVVKASSYPIDVARTNGNVQAYQQYRYSGTVRTSMPLVADLTYQIRDNFVMPSNPSPFVMGNGTYPGVGGLSATLAIVDGRVISAADMASAGFGHRTCGSESERDPDGNLLVTRVDGTPWPAGAIMGTATYQSATGESGSQARLVSVVRCAAAGEAANADGTVTSGEPVSLAPNQSFYVVTTLQTPARGKWQQATNTATPPAANGYSDAASTLRVTIDPQAPAEVIQQFVQNLDPVCTDCEFLTDERILRIDVKPGSSDNPIQPSSAGSIPVAIFGSLGLPVDWIDTTSLRLGDLQLKAHKAGNAQCSIEDVNLDGIQDLMCHFQNVASNWQADQTLVNLTGKLNNSEPVLASDFVRIIP